MKTKRQKFKPKKGQTDYSNIRWAPVINCVLTYKGKFLVVKRSEALNFYPGHWNGISGFLDDQRSLEQKVKDEVTEELGIPKSKIKRIVLGEITDQDDELHKKTWIVHPVLVEVATDKVRLDWEAEDYRWATEKEIKGLKLLPGFDRVLEGLLKYV